MNEYIYRSLSSKILEVQQFFPVTIITGPRQSGKTSLCRKLFPEHNYVNLEDITQRAFATNDPNRFLDRYAGPVIIDEVQNVPELLSAIQVCVDQDRARRFILTGSSNFALMHGITQSLSGRAALFTLLPLSLREISDHVAVQTTEQILFNGLYPGVIAGGIPVHYFYSNYYATYVERDVRQLLRVKNILSFDKFVRLLAARVGSELNVSALSKEAGVSAATINEWLSILNASYITYNVAPYFANVSKRLTKMPKVYFHDTGLLCYLLTLDQPEQLSTHPLRGAIFENLVMGELYKQRLNLAQQPSLYFYRESSGKEVDALIAAGGRLDLFEIKSAGTFRAEFSANMKYLQQLLPEVNRMEVIYDGPTLAGVAANFRELAIG
ncbi:MAG: ATP-binding protein [Muribaculaceae bacterium]